MRPIVAKLAYDKQRNNNTGVLGYMTLLTTWKVHD